MRHWYLQQYPTPLSSACPTGQVALDTPPSAMVRPRNRAILLLAALLICASQLAMTNTTEAQQARIAIDRAPHHVGIPATIEVTAEGFGTDKAPSCTPPDTPPGLTLKSLGQRPSSRSVRIQINGRLQRSESSYTFLYIALADSPGTFEIGPFSLIQGKQTAKTRPLTMQFQDIALDPNMRVAIKAPPGPYYVGQRVPITVEWWYAGNIDELSYENLSIRSPLFDMFRFEDTSPRKGTRLPLETSAGKIAVNADVDERLLNGRRFLVVSARRTMRIDQAVSGAAIPVHATAQIVTRWQRDFFGGRIPAGYRPIRTKGKPVDIHVEPLPLDDAPPGFAGAVGHGFSITAEADRSVVQVGDPITVTLTVRGDTDMNHIILPPLKTHSVRPGTGIVPSKFRLSDESPSGTVIEEGRAKRFKITLRPRDASISQIPPLLFSWFDPTTKSFETTQCDPIALKVTDARMIGAEDVVGQQPVQDAPDGHHPPLDNGADGPPRGQEMIDVPSVKRPHDLSGADLSICKDQPLLLTDHAQRYGGVKIRTTIYIGSILFLLMAAWLRHRNQLDPHLLKTRKMVREQLRHITHADRLPKQEAADKIASALRLIAPLAASTERDDIDRVVAECDVMSYARGDDGQSGFDRDMHDRAMKIARKIAVEAT